MANRIMEIHPAIDAIDGLMTTCVHHGIRIGLIIRLCSLRCIHYSVRDGEHSRSGGNKEASAGFDPIEALNKKLV